MSKKFYKYGEILALVPAINCLRQAKPDAEDKSDIKDFIKDLEIEARDTDVKSQELQESLREKLKGCASDEEKQELATQATKDLNDLYAEEIKLPSFKPEWFKYLNDLSIQDELEIEVMIKIINERESA